MFSDISFAVLKFGIVRRTGVAPYKRLVLAIRPAFWRATGGEIGNMQVAARMLISLCVLTSALASAYHNGAKLRRDGVLNLYPFPRVGRASLRAWHTAIPSDLVNERQYDPVEKRQLYAFPRVGRGDTTFLRASLDGAQLQGMPHRRTDGPGMWFGPRLGRSFRSEDDDFTDHSESSERSEPEQVESDQSEKDKRQAELQGLDTL